MSESPIFIVGVPRSGTTLLRLVINRHPRIAIPGETGYFREVYERYSTYPEQWREAVEFFTSWCEEGLRPPIQVRPLRDRLLAFDKPDYSLLCSLPMGQWAAAQGKSRWGEKTPYHIFHAESMMRLFPAAKIITMLRDPRSAVASMNRFPVLGNDTTLNARHWLDTYTKGSATLEAAVPASQRLTIRYEDLIEQPEMIVKQVCDFLDEQYDPSLLTFYETSARFEGTDLQPKTEQPIQGDPESWRNDLTDRQLATVEAVCGNRMEQLGYRRAGRRLRTGELAEVAAKIAYVIAKQTQHRNDRYHSVTYQPLGRFRRNIRSAGLRRTDSTR